MEFSTNLNIKLMRWNIAPNLDIDKISSLKCLLLGAGTLGCSVSRSLIGWGIQNISFVDNGKVSYSNPTRQCLFEFEHVGQFKSEIAARKLQEIYPLISSQGHILTIPMPDHIEQNFDEFSSTMTQLEDLIDSHDVIFLLTDTRESRYFPTLLCAAKNKLLINAALGFDSLLVMRFHLIVLNDYLNIKLIIDFRHGGHPLSVSESKEKKGENELDERRLGCYFCTDVISPKNSTINRTLDQQCTVTRPGLAMIAGGLCCELAVNIIHHPLHLQAPAPLNNNNSNSADQSSSSSETIMGLHRTTSSTNQQKNKYALLPHSIRMFLSSYSSVNPTIPAYNHCSACSPPIIFEYEKRGHEFLFQVCNQANILEEVSGLREIKEKLEENMDDVDFDWIEDEEDDF